MGHGIPLNAPTGTWTLAVRSQLTGRFAELPIEVKAPRSRGPIATALRKRVLARNARLVRDAVRSDAAHFVIPLFDSPHLGELLPIAQKLKHTLERAGAAAEIRQAPKLTTYWLAYDPTPEQAAENARADAGDALGKLKITTVNRNDYFATLGGYRAADHVVLLDLVGKPDNEMAEHLARVGALWPEATAQFPGPGRAIVHAVAQAFHPERTAIVVQAADAAGLLAGVQALTRLPDDWLGESVAEARTRLLRELHIDGSPASVSRWWLSARGLKTSQAPQPFAFRFQGAKPPTADAVQPPQPIAHKPITIPAVVPAELFLPQVRLAGAYEDAWSPGKTWKADLRFADATLLVIEVPKAGPTPITVEGTFRTSERRPRTQALWEDLLALRDTLVPRTRRPMAIDVLIDGKPAGRLEPSATATRDVPLDSPAWHTKVKPKTVAEEVVVRLSGTITLPAGRHELLLIHRNMVDGHLDKLHLGAKP